MAKDEETEANDGYNDESEGEGEDARIPYVDLFVKIPILSIFSFYCLFSRYSFAS